MVNSEIRISDDILDRQESQSERFRSIAEPAVYSKQIFDYITDNPNCPSNELIRHAGLDITNRGQIYPELPVLVKNLILRRKRVREAYRDLSEESGGNGKKIAKVLFDAVCRHKDANRPTGNLQLGRLDNPLALSLVMNSDDFKRLEGIEASGYFRANLKFKVKDFIHRIPFIAVEQQADKREERRIFDHEMGHLKYAYMTEALRATNQHEYPGIKNYRSIESHKIKTLEGRYQALLKEGIPLSSLRETTEWKTVQALQYSWGKTELIAKMCEDPPYQSITYPLFNEDASYNIYKNIGVSDPNLRKLLWDDYVAVLTKSLSATLRLTRIYGAFNLEKKKGLLPWILMRVPFDKWESTLNQTGLTSEAEWLTRIAKKVKQYNTSRQKSAGTSPLTQNVLNNPVMEVVEKYQTALGKHPPEELMLLTLQRFSDELDEIITPSRN